MTVGEFYPGGGYFTRMLSKVVGPGGHVYGIENAGWKGAVDADKALLAEGKLANVSIDVQPFGTVAFPKPLDLAWVTQNYHDLKMAMSTRPRSTVRSLPRCSRAARRRKISACRSPMEF